MTQYESKPQIVEAIKLRQNLTLLLEEDDEGLQHKGGRGDWLVQDSDGKIFFVEHKDFVKRYRFLDLSNLPKITMGDGIMKPVKKPRTLRKSKTGLGRSVFVTPVTSSGTLEIAPEDRSSQEK